MRTTRKIMQPPRRERPRDWPPFRDRRDAGRLLAEELRGRALDRPIVLGIPRGGVVISAEIARALGWEHGTVVARKLGAPRQPELAVGAVTADGSVFLDEEIVGLAGVSADYLAEEQARQTQEARRREDLYTGGRRPDVSGRVVVIVDDGVATGATATVAIRALRAAGARQVIFAVPVGPPHTIARLRREADEVICLYEEPHFVSVGQFYQDFSPTDDDTVIALLRGTE